MRKRLASRSMSLNFARMSSRVMKISRSIHGRVAISRRDQESIHAEPFEKRKQLLNLVHVGFLVDRGVRADHEAGCLGGLDALDRFLENPLALDGDVVVFLHAVEMDVEEEAGIGLEFA